MAPISFPLASRLQASLRLPATSPLVTRVMGRLAWASLVSLALDWTDEANQALTAPFLKDDDADDDDDDSDDFYPPAHSLYELQEYYHSLSTRPKGSRREVLDRMLEGDWRHGITMYQLAMADLQYLYYHRASQRWTAYQVVPLQVTADAGNADGADDGDDDIAVQRDGESLTVPRFHPSSFLRSLQAQILPDVKVHYNFDRHPTLPLLVLRIFVLDSPYNTSLAVTDAAAAGSDAARTMYVAFPDAAPYVYISNAQSSADPPGTTTMTSTSTTTTTTKSKASESRSLRSLVVDAIPKALSRPRARYALRPARLTTRNLDELLDKCGAGRSNAAGGGWGLYADERATESPLSTVPPPSVRAQLEAAMTKDEPRQSQTTKRTRRAVSPGAVRDARLAKRRRQIAAARFGTSSRIDDGLGVERVDITMQDVFQGEARDDGDDERPSTTTTRGKGGRRSQLDDLVAREDEEEARDGVAAGPDDEPDGAWRPRVAFTFQGPHVFAGIRQLVEAGVIDGEAMPGWMTGEEGVTVGVVRDGRIRGHRGSGM